ncbi:MAG TPA: LysM peptidoglycan-binding domain-containing protein [Flavisolibacter sp.]|jgi:nucleoid-associated protein YgaU
MALETGSLRNKYQELIDAAELKGVTNMQVRQQGSVMYIDGTAPSARVKQELWEIYGRIDPNYRAGDLVLNINSFETVEESLEEYEVVSGDNLSKIAGKYNLTWRDIYEANKDKIQDPDLIQPGWKLKIPKK